jgi:hypothetical protein
MKPTKFIAGVFNDPELILRSAESFKNSGIRVYDCYTPFAVHGLDKPLGIKRTRLSIAAFLYGCTGLTLSLIMQNYMSFIDWPINIGGKPNTPVLPTFVPVCFESTVLCTALLTIFTFWAKSRMFHGVTPDLFDDRQTSDLFILAIDADSHSNHAAIEGMLKEHGAIEVRHKEFSDKHSLIQ